MVRGRRRRGKGVGAERIAKRMFQGYVDWWFGSGVDRNDPGWCSLRQKIEAEGSHTECCVVDVGNSELIFTSVWVGGVCLNHRIDLVSSLSVLYVQVSVQVPINEIDYVVVDRNRGIDSFEVQIAYTVEDGV